MLLNFRLREAKKLCDVKGKMVEEQSGDLPSGCVTWGKWLWPSGPQSHPQYKEGAPQLLSFKYQGYKDITVHKLTPGCHLLLSRAVLCAPKRANLLCSLLQQLRQLKRSREWPGQLREHGSCLLHGEPFSQRKSL